MSQPAEPPESPVFFTDRDLGSKILPRALRAAGFTIVSMQEHYGAARAQRALDHEWIPEIAGLGMAILTNDQNMRFTPLVPRAILRSRTRCFALPRQNV